MGKRGRPPKIAALPGAAWGTAPKISKAEAEAMLGAPLSDGVWEDIQAAFEDYGFAIAMLGAPRSNWTRDGYQKSRARALRFLRKGAPISQLGLSREILRDFADNAELAALEEPGGVAEMTADPEAFAARFDWRTLTQSDPDSVKRAREILEAAAPRDHVPTTEAQVRRKLVRRLRAILSRAGLPTALRGREGVASGAAVKPFERLIAALGLHSGHSGASLSDWLIKSFKNNS